MVTQILQVQDTNLIDYIRDCIKSMKLTDAINTLRANIPAAKQETFNAEFRMASTISVKRLLCLDWLSEINQ